MKPNGPRTTEQAMRQHKSRHADKIVMGEAVAIDLCTIHGKTSTQDVLSEMRYRGHIDGEDRGNWAPAIFRFNPLFVKVGEERYSDPSRNAHQVLRSLYALKQSLVAVA